MASNRRVARRTKPIIPPLSRRHKRKLRGGVAVRNALSHDVELNRGTGPDQQVLTGHKAQHAVPNKGAPRKRQGLSQYALDQRREEPPAQATP